MKPLPPFAPRPLVQLELSLEPLAAGWTAAQCREAAALHGRYKRQLLVKARILELHGDKTTNPPLRRRPLPLKLAEYSAN